MSTEDLRAGMYVDLTRRGWSARSAAKIVVAAHPRDDDRSPKSGLARVFESKSFSVKWEVDHSVGPDNHIRELVEKTLRSYQEAARAEGDDYYSGRYDRLLDRTDDPEAKGYLDVEHTPPARRGEGMDARRSAVLSTHLGVARTATLIGGSAVVACTVILALRMDGASQAYGLAGLMLGTAISLIAWMTWLHGERRYADPALRDSRFSVTWSWAGWLVPFLNVYVPYAVALEVEKAHNAELRGVPQWRSAIAGSSTTVWWSMLLAGSVLSTAGVVGVHTGAGNLNPTILLMASALLFLGALINGDRTMKRISSLRASAQASTQD